MLQTAEEIGKLGKQIFCSFTDLILTLVLRFFCKIYEISDRAVLSEEAVFPLDFFLMYLLRKN